MGDPCDSYAMQPVAPHAGCLHGSVHLQAGQGLVVLEVGREGAVESSNVGWERAGSGG